MKKIFRAPHLLMLLAATLNGVMLFAPVAYASNFRSNIYAEVYGSWVNVVKALEPQSKPELIWFYEDIFLLLYSAFAVLGAGWLLFILFFQKGDAAKVKILPSATVVQLIHLGFGVLLYFHADSFVGVAAPEYLESSFQRELSLHVFIILFTISCRRRYRKAISAPQAGQQEMPS